MRIIKLFLSASFLVIICFQKVNSQEIKEPSYDLSFLKAIYKPIENSKDYSNKIVLYFRYSKKAGNETLLSMRIKYKLSETAEEIVENIEKSKHSIIVYGTGDIKKKNREVYNLLKDVVDFKSKDEFFIFAFHLRDITNHYIPKMYFAYGLWEPLNPNIRLENYFEVNISK